MGAWSLEVDVVVAVADCGAAFWHQRYAEVDDFFGGAADQIVFDAVNLGNDRALVRLHDAHDAFHQRRFAVAVGAEQHHGLAGLGVERDFFEHANRADLSACPSRNR